MEKLVFGLSILAILYIVFFYLTIKTLWEDASVKIYASNTQKRSLKDEASTKKNSGVA